MQSVQLDNKCLQFDVTERCNPKPIKKALKSHPASLGDKEFYNKEHGQARLTEGVIALRGTAPCLYSRARLIVWLYVGHLNVQYSSRLL